MKSLLFAALVAVFPGDGLWHNDVEVIRKNYEATARSCFKIGTLLQDMKDNPVKYLPHAYATMLKKSHEACFVEEEK